MKKITISILPFLQSSSIINLEEKDLAFSGGIDPAHEAESQLAKQSRLKANVIKFKLCFSRQDAKAQSLEPISLRLRVLARVIFIKNYREVLNIITLG